MLGVVLVLPALQSYGAENIKDCADIHNSIRTADGLNFTDGYVRQESEPLTLEQVLGIAKKNRAVVRSAELRLEQARLARKSLAAPPSTRIDLQATSNRGLFGNDDDIVLAQPIDLFGRRKANGQLGDAQIQLAQASLRQTIGEVQNEVVDRYAELVAANQFVQTASAQLELAQRLLDATKRKADGGAIPPVQVKRVNIEVERARQTLLLRQSNFTASRRRLAGALGVSPDGMQVSDFATIPTDAVNLATLLSQRADLLQLSAQSAIARANVAVSRVQSRPDFEISARTSPYSYGPNQPSGIRATFSFPLFDFGRTKYDVRANLTAAEAAQKALDDASSRAQAELDAVSIELAAAIEQREGFDRLLADSRELVRVSEVGFREGATTLIEVLEASRSLREVEEGLVEARLHLAQAQAAYLKVTGKILGEKLQ